MNTLLAPPTRPQYNYVVSLGKRLRSLANTPERVDVVDEFAALVRNTKTSEAASALIDAMKLELREWAQEDREAKLENSLPLEVPTPAEIVATQKKRNPPPAEGAYYFEGDFYRVFKDSYNNTRVKRWNPDTRKWNKSFGVWADLNVHTKLTAEQAGDFGRLYGVCVFCGRTLSDERSCLVGYGPICAKHHDLPWGELPVEPDTPVLVGSQIAIVGV